MNREPNIITLTDSYKTSHYLQYPEGTETVYSYLESRGGLFDNTVFFGLQYFLKNYLVGKVVTLDKINRAERMIKANGVPFNRAGWEHIVKDHNGHLPVCIKAVPEGTVVGGHNVLMTVENTCPKCFWLTNYLESLLLQVWYPTTVATLSREMKKVIGKYLNETGDIAGINFKLQDFGFRGVSSVESAKLGGAAHLVNFLGTDTMVALEMLEDNYFAEIDNIGFSIPASEHSTITSWGRENEALAMENMLDKYPEGLVACVSDSYNIWEACSDIWGTKLKDKILNRNGTLVVRPDSGNPVEVVTKVIETLMDKFGYTVNDKGFRVLPPQIRMIQGDGITIESTRAILENMKLHKLSVDNAVFGMGGGLLQKVDRDTLKFAFKCSAANVNGQWRDVYKQPVDEPFKKSKKGIFRLIRNANDNNKFETCQLHENLETPDELQTVFANGVITKFHTLDAIRKRAEILTY